MYMYITVDYYVCSDTRICTRGTSCTCTCTYNVCLSVEYMYVWSVSTVLYLCNLTYCSRPLTFSFVYGHNQYRVYLFVDYYSCNGRSKLMYDSGIQLCVVSSQPLLHVSSSSSLLTLKQSQEYALCIILQKQSHVSPYAFRHSCCT